MAEYIYVCMYASSLAGWMKPVYIRRPASLTTSKNSKQGVYAN